VEAAWHHRKAYRPGVTMRARWDQAPAAARARGHEGNHRLHHQAGRRERRHRPGAGRLVLVAGRHGRLTRDQRTPRPERSPDNDLDRDSDRADADRPGAGPIPVTGRPRDDPLPGLPAVLHPGRATAVLQRAARSTGGRRNGADPG